METLGSKPPVIVDGAHNPEGASSLAAYVREVVRKPVILIFDAMKDKDIGAIAGSLFPLARTVVLTRVPMARAAEPEEVLRLWKGRRDNILIEPDIGRALKLAESLAGTRIPVLAAGSLFLVGEVKKRISRRCLGRRVAFSAWKCYIFFASGQENDMLSIDLTFIVIFLLVWILVLVLTRVFFKPVGRILEKRRDRESGDREAARAALEAGERDLRRIEDELREARASSERLREELEAKALGEKAKLLADVQADARDRIDKAKAELEDQVRRLKDQLEGETARLAESIEKKVAH